MIEIALFVLAVVMLSLGHYFKMLRWNQFIEIYEHPSRKSLLQALITGYIVNFYIPFRLGDLVRAILAGRKLKNGIGFSLATVIVDRYLDILVVGIIFYIMSGKATVNAAITESATFYGLLSFALVVMLSIAIKYSAPFKKLIRKICMIFNTHIEFELLFFLWSIVNAFKDIFYQLNKALLVFYSGAIWICYLLSYYVLASFISLKGYNTTFSDVFVLLFSKDNLNIATLGIQQYGGNYSDNIQVYLVVYIALPLVLLSIYSYLIQKILPSAASAEENQPLKVQLLPLTTEHDRLNFLENYFSSEQREYLQKYLKLNRDVRILEDFSAGSNATTILCMNENQTFYRKYAFEKDADKLYLQVRWLDAHKEDIPLPIILKAQRGEGFCSYDMEYHATAVGLFNYFHSTSLEKSWSIMERALEDLAEHLHSKHVRPANPETTRQYIKEKVLKNVAKIKSSKDILPLLEYEVLQINGKEFRNLKQLEPWFNEEFLFRVFSEDLYADIHGDFTVENIIYWEGNTGIPYYFIDPNTGNLHESPALDYAKLLQSLHGGYEFLMKTDRVLVEKNRIQFLFTQSHNYNDIFQRYRSYLESRFTRQQVRSIFFHEIVHWFRLMPYKIEKNGKLSVLFYAGLIIVFNDVVKWYGDDID